MEGRFNALTGFHSNCFIGCLPSGIVIVLLGIRWHHQKMELYQLKSFIAVANTGNLTQAAEKLFTSQPAVSAQIKALEEEFELKLFKRSAKGMVLTEDGILLKEKALKVLDASKALKVQADQLKGEISGKVKIGLNSDADFLRLSEWLIHLLNYFPRVKVELIQGTSSKLIKNVELGLLDMSFVSKEINQPRLNSIKLLESYGVIAAAPKWAEQLSTSHVDDLTSMPWLLPEPQCIYHEFIDDLFRHSGTKPNFMTITGSEESALKLLLSGAGLAILRDDQAAELLNENKAVVWETKKFYAPLNFICLAKRQNEPVIKCLQEVVSQVFLSDGLLELADIVGVS